MQTFFLFYIPTTDHFRTYCIHLFRELVGPLGLFPGGMGDSDIQSVSRILRNLVLVAVLAENQKTLLHQDKM